MKATTLGFQSTVTGFKSPTYELDSGLVTSGLTINSQEVVDEVSYTQSDIPFFTRLAAAVTNPALRRTDTAGVIYKGDKEDWTVSLSATLAVPSTGGMQLILDGDATFTEEVCLNYDLAGSTILGTVKCVSASNVMTVFFDTSQQASTLYVLILKVDTGTTASKLTVRTLHDASSPSSIQEETVHTVVYSGTSLPMEFSVPLQFQYFDFCRFGSTGVLSMYIDVPVTVTTPVSITLPDGITPAAGGQLRCVVGGILAQSCSQSGASVTMSPPVSGLAPGVRKIELTTTNADVPEAQGMYFNPNGGPGDYVVTLSYAGFTASDVLTVLPAVLFADLKVKAGHTSHGELNFFKVTMNLSQKVDSMYKVCFPTADESGNRLFLDDLGTGVKDSYPIPCQAIAPLSTATCRLWHGFGSASRPACIVVSNVNTLNSGDTPGIWFDGISNPPNPGTDNLHVDIAVYAYNGGFTSDKMTIAHTFFDVFTVTTASVAHLTKPAPTLAASKPYTATTIDGITLDGTDCSPTSSMFIFELSTEFTLTRDETVTGCGTTCSVHSSSNWIVCESSSCCGGTASIGLTATSMKYSINDRVIKVFLISSDTLGNRFLRSVSTLDPFAKPAPYLGGNASVIQQFLGTTNRLDFWVTTYELTQILPAGGAFNVVYSTPPDASYCRPSYLFITTSTATPWTCSISGSTLLFAGFAQDQPSGTKIRLITLMNTASSLSVSAQITTCLNAVCSSSEIEQSNPAASTSLSAVPGPSEFAIGHVLSPKQVVSSGGRAELLFHITPKARILGSLDSDYIEVTVDDPITIAGLVFCELRTVSYPARRRATLCSYSGGKFTIHPSGNLEADVEVVVRIYSTSADQGLNGLILSSSLGQNALTIKTYSGNSMKDIGFVYFRHPANLLPFLKITPAHITHNKYNVLQIDFTLGTAELLSTDCLYVEFPSRSLDGSKRYFQDDLGIGQAVNDYTMPCVFTGFTGSPVCKLLRGSDAANVNPRVQVSNGAVAASGTASILLAEVHNPDASSSLAGGDDYIMHFRVVVTNSTGEVKYEKYIFHAFALEKTIAMTAVASWSGTIIATWQDGQVYTVTISTVPAGLTLSGLIVVSPDTYFYINANAGGTYFASNNSLYVSSMSGASYQVTTKSPPHNGAISGVKVYILAKTTGSLEKHYCVGDSTTVLPAAIARGKTTGFIAKSLPWSGWDVGLWHFVHLYALMSSISPAGYLTIDLSGVTFDPGMLYVAGFGSYFPKVSWSVLSSKVSMWGFGQLSGGDMGLHISLKGKADLVVNIKLCVDPDCTFVYGSDDVYFDPLPGVSRVPFSETISLSFDKRAGQDSITWTITMRIGVPLSAYNCSPNDFDGMYLRMEQFDAGTSGPMDTCLIGADQCSVHGWDSTNKEYYALSDIDLNGAIVFKFYKSGSPVFPTGAGYYHVEIYTWRAVKTLSMHEYALMKIFVPPVASFNGVMGSGFDSWISASNSLSVFEVSLQFTVTHPIGSQIQFCFPTSWDGAKYSNHLGFGPNRYGLSVPFTVSNSLPVSDCFLAQGGSGLGFHLVGADTGSTRIICALSSTVAPSASPYVFTFPGVQTPPAGTVTLKYEVFSYKVQIAFYEYASYTVTKSFISQTCSVIAGGLLKQARVSTVNTLNFGLITDSLTSSSTGYFLLIIGPNVSLSGLTTGANVSLYKTIDNTEPCPCVILKYTGSETTAPTFQVNLLSPLAVGTASIYVYPVLKNASTCGSIYEFTYESTTPAIDSSTATERHTVTYPFSFFQGELTLLQVSFTPSVALPESSCIQLTAKAATANPLSFSNLPSLTGKSVKAITSSDSINITDFAPVAAGTTITINNIYISLTAATFSYTIKTYINSDCSTGQIGLVPTVPFTVDTNYGYLSPSLETPSLLSGYTPPNGFGNLVFYFRPYQNFASAFPAGTFGGEIRLSSPLFSTLASSLFFATFTDDSGNELLSMRTYVTGSTLTISTPARTVLSSSSFWNITVGSHSPNEGISLTSDQQFTVSQKESSSASVTPIATVKFPYGVPFANLSVRTLKHNAGSDPTGIIIQLNTQSAVTKSATQFPETVIEFPLLDSGRSTDPLFAPDLASSVPIGGAFPCGVYVADTLKPNAVCKLFPGLNPLQSLSTAYPTQVIISNFGNLAAGQNLLIALAGLHNPANDSVADLVIFTRTVSSVEAAQQSFPSVIFDFQKYEAAILPYNSSPSTFQANHQIRGSNVFGTISDWRFELVGPAQPTPATIDTFVFVFNPGYDASFMYSYLTSRPSTEFKATINATNNGTTQNPLLAVIPAVGWIVEIFGTPVPAGSDLVMYLPSVRNPWNSYYSMEITGFSCGPQTSASSLATTTYAFSKDGISGSRLGLAAEPETVHTSPLTAANYFGTLDNRLFASALNLIQVRFTLVRPVPTTGMIQITFGDWTGVGTCASYSAGYTAKPDCVSAAKQWQVYAGLEAGSTVDFWGYVENPNIAGTFSISLMSLSNPSDVSTVIDSAAGEVTILACCALSTPAAFRIPMQRNTAKRIVRSGQTGPLIFTLSPAQTFTAGGNFDVKLSAGSAPTLVDGQYYVCKFTPFGQDSHSYRGAGCTVTANGYHCVVPFLAQISAAVLYTVTLSTAGVSSFLRPADNTVTVTARFDFNNDTQIDSERAAVMQIFPSLGPSTAVLTPICRSADFYSNILKVHMKMSLGPFSTDRLAIIFPSTDENGASLFSTDLGGHNHGEVLGCYHDSSLSPGTDCRLKHSFPRLWGARHATVELVGQVAASDLDFTFYIPSVKNPTAAERIVWLGVVAYHYNAGQVEITSGVYLWNVFGTSASSNPSPTLRKTYMFHMNNPVTGEDTTTTVIYLDGTDGDSALSVNPSESLLLVSSLPMGANVQATGMIARFVNHYMVLLTNAGATPVTKIEITEMLKANFASLEKPPSLDAYLFSNALDYTALLRYNQPESLNFQLSSGTVSLSTHSLFSATVREELLVSFTSKWRLPSQGSVAIAFTGGDFELDSRCLYRYSMKAGNPNPVLAVGQDGEVSPCTTLSNIAVLSNLGIVDPDVTVFVSVWGRATTAGSLAVEVKTYWDRDQLKPAEFSSFAFSRPDIAVLSTARATSPVLHSSGPVRRNSVGPFSLSLQLAEDSNIPAGTGSVTVKFSETVLSFAASPVNAAVRYAKSLPPPPYLVCLWMLSGVTHLGQSCVLTGTTLTVTAPFSTSIVSGSEWRVKVTTTMQTYVADYASEGVTFTDVTAGDFYVTAETTTDFGGAFMFLPPPVFPLLVVTPLGKAISKPTAISVSFTASWTLTGGSELLIQFDGSQTPLSLGDPGADFSHQVWETDCYGLASFPSAKCYIHRGTADNTPSPELWIRNFDNVPALTQVKLLLSHFVNPPNNGAVCSVRVAMRAYSTATARYEYSHYAEVQFLYMTESSKVVLGTDSSVYGSNATVQSVVTVSLKLVTPSPLAVSDSLVLLSFESGLPEDVSGASLSGSHQCYFGRFHRSWVVLPTSTITTGTVLNFSNFPTPMYPLLQKWTASVIVDRENSAEIAYQSASFATVPGTCSVSIIEDPTLLANRRVSYILVVSPMLAIPVGGQILITIPARLDAPLAGCEVLDGLKGAKCQFVGPNTYKVFGFLSEFNPQSLSIVARMRLEGSVAGPLQSFSVIAEGVADDSSTLISTSSFSPNIALIDLPGNASQFTVQATRLFQPQAPACTGETTHFSIDISPRSPYPTSASVAITLPVGVAMPGQGVLECSISDGHNTVPSEVCGVSGLTVSVSVPEQMRMAVGTTYTVYLKYRDSGNGLAADGFTLPSLVSVRSSGGFAAISLSVQDASGKAIEEGKAYARLCSQRLSAVTFLPAHTSAGEAAFYDVTVTAAARVPANSYIELRFPTDNELSSLFATDLGFPSLQIDCQPFSGFASSAIDSITCSLQQASAQSPSTPAIVRVTGYSGIDAGTVSVLRLIGVQNPVSTRDSIHSQKLTGYACVSVIDSTTPLILAYGCDYRVFAQSPLATSSPVSLSALVAVTNMSPIYTHALVSGPSSLQYSFGGTGGTELGPAGGFIVFVMDPAFDLSDKSLISCDIPGTTCSAFHHSISNWIIVSVTGSSVVVAGGLAVNLASLHTPDYTQSAGYSVTAYVYSSPASGQQWTHTFSATLPSMKASKCSISVQRSSPPFSLTPGTYDIYTVAITPIRSASKVVRIDILFPTEFQWIDSACLGTHGFEELAGSLSCQSDCPASPCSKRVSVTGFKPLAAGVTLAIDIGAMGPNSAGITSNFEVYLFTSKTDTTLVAENRLDQGAVTVANTVRPFDLWVEWVTQTQRVVQTGDFGELIIRMEGNKSIPPGGLIEINLAFQAVLAPDRTLECRIGYGTNQFSLFPLLHERGKTKAETCTSSGSTITLKYPPAVPREWSGTAQMCTYVSVTTSGHTVSSVEGLKAPAGPGWYSVQVQTKDSSGVPLDSLASGFTVAPIDATLVRAVSNVHDSDNTEAILQVSLQAAVTIPRGYVYLNNNAVGVRGTIVVQFELYQSFAADLGQGYETGAAVPCLATVGITGRNGGPVECRFETGDDSLTYPSPSVIYIRGFEAVLPGTLIEVHFPKVTYPSTVGYIPRLKIGAFTADAQGTLTWIIHPTATALPAATQRSALQRTDQQAVLSPSTVLTESVLKLPFIVSKALTAGDMFVVSFPGSYPISDKWSVQAKVTNAAATSVVQQALATQVYATAGRMAVVLNGSIPSAVLFILEISHVTNPEFTPDIDFTWAVSRSGALAWIYSGNSVTVKSADVSVDSFLPSKTNSAAVDVSLTFAFKVNAGLPSGSQLTLTFPAMYPPLDASTPVPLCACSVPETTCAIEGGSAVVRGISTLPPLTAISLTITGVKNPTASSATGFKVQCVTQSGNTVVDTLLPQKFQFTAPESVATLNFTLSPDIISSNLVTKYSLKVSSSAGLPNGSIMTLLFPAVYSLNPGLECVRVRNLPSYQSCKASSRSSLELILAADLPASQEFTLDLEGIRNPIAPVRTSIGPFSMSAVYDSVMIAQSGHLYQPIASDVSTKVDVMSSALTPVNETLHGQYTFEVRTNVKIPASSDSIVLLLVYPEEYSSELVGDPSSFSCLTSPFSSTCAIHPSGKVVFSRFSAAIAESTNVTLSLFKIVNPRHGKTGQTAIYVVDSSTNEALAYNETAGCFEIGPPPPADPVSTQPVDVRPLLVYAFDFHSEIAAKDGTETFHTENTETSPDPATVRTANPVPGYARGYHFDPDQRIRITPDYTVGTDLIIDFTVKVDTPGTIWSKSRSDTVLGVSVNSDWFLELTFMSQTVTTTLAVLPSWTRVVVTLVYDLLFDSTRFSACSSRYQAMGAFSGRLMDVDSAVTYVGARPGSEKGFRGFLRELTVYNNTVMAVNCYPAPGLSDCGISQVADADCHSCQHGCLSCLRASDCSLCDSAFCLHCSEFGMCDECAPQSNLLLGVCQPTQPAECTSFQPLATTSGCTVCVTADGHSSISCVCPTEAVTAYPWSVVSGATDMAMPECAKDYKPKVAYVEMIAGVYSKSITVAITPRAYLRTISILTDYPNVNFLTSSKVVSAGTEGSLSIKVGVPAGSGNATFVAKVTEDDGFPLAEIVYSVTSLQSTNLTLLAGIPHPLSISVPYSLSLALAQNMTSSVEIAIRSNERDMIIDPASVKLSGSTAIVVMITLLAEATAGVLNLEAIGDNGSLFALVPNSIQFDVIPPEEEIPTELLIQIEEIDSFEAVARITTDRLAVFFYYLVLDSARDVEISEIMRVNDISPGVLFTNIEDFTSSVWLNHLKPDREYWIWVAYSSVKTRNCTKAFQSFKTLPLTKSKLVEPARLQWIKNRQ